MELFISDSGFPSEGGREIQNRKSKIQNAKEGSGGESKIANPKSKMKQIGDPGCEFSRPALRYHKPAGKRALTQVTWPDPLAHSYGRSEVRIACRAIALGVYLPR